MLSKHNMLYLTKSIMEIYEKVRFFREQKKLSQEFVSTFLNIEQSQFSRRESGQIPFSINELEKLSELFDVKISDFFKEKTVNLSSNNQSRNSFEQNIYLPDRLIKQYEMRLKEKDEMIALMKEQIKNLNK